MSFASITAIPVANGDSASLRVGVQYDLSKWVLAYDVEATSQDAIVFPFRRQGSANLQILDGQKRDPRSKKGENEPGGTTWRRVLESFVQNRSLDDDELEQSEVAAKMLVEVHPVDQVLLIAAPFPFTHTDVKFARQ